jgi:hypothetical protein
MNRIIYKILFTLVIASLTLTACSSPTTIAPSNTPAQATVTIAPSATALLPTNTPIPTNTASPTVPPAPTNTPLPTEALTPIQAPNATSTPGTAAVSPTSPPSSAGASAALVNENTNCRSGPSADYTLIYTFLAGQTAKVVSRTTLDDYLLVENPENPPETCWLWTQYVTASGDLASLPVATTPPPLVSYSLAFTRIQTCSVYSIEFKVLNTGTKTIQAYTVVVKDLTSYTQQTSSNTVFDLVEGCTISQPIGYIDPGKIGYMYGNDFSYDPTGHSMEADVTICSHNDMTGVCVSQVILFTPK